MKSLCAVLIAILLAVTLAHGARAEVATGALGGLTRMSWGGDTPERGRYNAVHGFTLGAELDVRVYRSTWLSIQPSFAQKGTKMSFEVRGESERVDSVEVRLDYLTIPILLKVETLRKRFYVTGGFELAWLLNARYKSPSSDLDVSVEFKDYDLAVDFGIGYTIPAGHTEIFLELRYSQSMSNIGNEHKGPEDYIEPRVKNQGLLLLVGVLYDF